MNEAIKIIDRQIRKAKRYYSGIDVALDAHDLCGHIFHNDDASQKINQLITEYQNRGYAVRYTEDAPTNESCYRHLSIEWK